MHDCATVSAALFCCTTQHTRRHSVMLYSTTNICKAGECWCTSHTVWYGMVWYTPLQGGAITPHLPTFQLFRLLIMKRHSPAQSAQTACALSNTFGKTNKTMTIVAYEDGAGECAH